MFSDSEIGKQFQCQRSKATYITTYALGPAATAPVIACMQRQPVSILTDEATDRADDKTVLIMARHYDEHKDSVIISFVANPVCPIADARTLFGHLDKFMVDNKIPWSNVMGQSSDSASTVVGRHK